jgi:hypothetical protein
VVPLSREGETLTLLVDYTPPASRARGAEEEEGDGDAAP